MGTLVTITLYARSDERAQQGFRAAFQRIAELDSILSDYREDSELSRACESPGPLSPDLFHIVKEGQRLAEESGGAFDITIGQLTQLWRRERARQRLPDPPSLAKALAASGYRKLRLDDRRRRVRCLHQDLRLDAGGIAKGYAADQAIAVLRKTGIRRALVALSGDIVAGDPPPGRSGWRVKTSDQVISLANAAVSTSGDEFQNATISGARHSHIVDPRTGVPLRNSAEVSVVARTGLEADSLATTFSVMEPGAAQALAKKRKARIIVRSTHTARR